MNNFDESKHPRDNDGKFTDGGGKESANKNYQESINKKIKYAKKHNIEIPISQNGSIDDSRLSTVVQNDVTKRKNQQLEIINKSNPMLDDYHTGIRKAEDIKTWEEAMSDNESFEWGDFSREDAEKAMKNGKITIYSSKPISNGNFVSTSYNQARDYAGGGKIYSQEIPLEDVAWINGDEGQYAKIL